MKIVTCIAPVNIAVIKYWGKRDEDLILPINDSISSTLSTENMCAKTTIMASPDFLDDKFWLNGKEETLNNQRLQNCLAEVKKRAGEKELLPWNIHICSVNNFPTAAGLASSAAGYACLVSALSSLYKVSGDVSHLARLGSGSACRSIYGGWVRWHKGLKPDGSDSIATPIVEASHWPQMRIIVLVVNDQQKKCSSTIGMQRSVQTSEFLKYRAENIAPRRTKAMIDAIKTRNFEQFASITMQDSNQFHSVCLDTYPPCVYMNDISHSIVDMVHTYNDFKKTVKVAYTFDAGPNACLYLLEQDLEEFAALVNQVYPPPSGDQGYFRGNKVAGKNIGNLKDKLNLKTQNAGCLKYVIYTGVGEGPQILTHESEHLLNAKGLPK